MFIGQCIHDMAVSHGLVISLFIAGLVGGFTHCAGMCSPFVLAQVDGVKGVGIKRIPGLALLPYHFGRMTTYVTLAVLVATALNLAFVFSDLKALIAAPMLVLAAVIFLVSAFPGLSALFPWVVNLQMAVPYKFIERFASKLMNNPGVLKRYGLGVLLGFMPCGLVISALLASSTAPTVAQTAMAMVAFTVGTMPALMLVAFGGYTLKRKYPKASTRLTQGAMVMSSLWLFALAGIMVF